MPQAINTEPTPLILTMPGIVSPLPSKGNQEVFFETSREDVEDREGEDIACEALWNSRNLFLSQGNFDLGHFSWLGNPYGTGGRPEYVLGHPAEVKKKDKSIWVRGEIFKSRGEPPPGSNGDWARWFYYSINDLEPPMKYHPSVFGQIQAGGTSTKQLNGKLVKYITKLEWLSVGFALRAQHPTLPAVSSTPVGPFAKAADLLNFHPREMRQSGALVMDFSTFAKALTVGTPITDSAMKVGVQALTPESLEGKPKPYGVAAKSVLKRVLLGECPAKLRSIQGCFEEQGCDKASAKQYAQRLLQEVALKN